MPQREPAPEPAPCAAPDPPGAEPVLVSACLVGKRCRYDGRDSRDLVLEDDLAREGLRAVPFCPEEHGGLGTPRPAAWIAEGDAAAVVAGGAHMIDENGREVTAPFLHGARGALDTCRTHGIRRAFLKERSPSCGVRQTYVGNLPVPGPGVTSEVLRLAGIALEGVEGRRAPRPQEEERTT